MITFNEYRLNESINKGKLIDSFKMKIDNKEYNFTINQKDSEYRLNIEGTNKFLFKLKTSDVDNAKKELGDMIKKVTVKRFVDEIEKNKDDIERRKNDTDWEVFSEYKTSRGSMAFIVYHCISNGKSNWKQEPRGKKYLSIHMTSKEVDVKKEIENEVKTSKLKYVSGWNAETDK